MSSDIDLQRRRDGAFFEDWSAWASLDDLPPPDKPAGRYIQWPARHNRYWCVLRSRVDWIGGPAFELSLPSSSRIASMARRLPGARQHPALLGAHRTAFARLGETWFVPAEHWVALKIALPSIKQAVKSWCAERV